MIRWGAGKTLARPGRKQATATKLGIYSTHSPRRSIHFWARCSNFCKPLKKKIKRLSVQPGHRGRNDLRVGDLSIVFSVQGTGGSPTGPDLENRVGDQDTGSPGRPVSSGLQVLGEPGHCARTRPSWWPSRGVTYLLTPWCRFLLEQLTGLQLVKKFPTFHGTRRFITALTSVRYLSLYWASPIQST